MDPTAVFPKTLPTLSALLCFSLLPAAGASAQDLGDQDIAPGPAIPVNSVTAGTQDRLDMDLAPNDDMVIVWRQDTSTVVARRVSRGGSLTPGTDFVVNSNTGGTKERPAVCVDSAGNVVVAWEEDDGTAPGSRDIRYRRFDSSFTPLGDEGLAASFATGSQIRPDVACGPNGEFTIVWGGSSEADADGVTGRRFAADGSPIGDDFQISTELESFGNYPGVHVASDDNGDFVVVWAEVDGASRSLNARRFSADGVALDAVPLEVASGDYVYKIGLDKDGPGGDFVVSWNDSSNFGQDIEAQRFDSSGVPEGSIVFPLASFTAAHETSVAFSGPNGEVVVAWNNADGGTPARAQRLDAAMQPIGAEFFIAEGDGVLPSFDTFDLEGNADGELFLAYPDIVPGQSRDIFARHFLQAFFADGFESGDTAEWTSTVP